MTVNHVNMAAIARMMERNVLSVNVLMVSKVPIVQRKVRLIIIALLFIIYLRDLSVRLLLNSIAL